jgi:PKHD-type hydroxylase
MMLTIPDVLMPDEVRRCRDALEQANWQDGSQTAGHVAARAKNNEQLAQDDPLTARLGDFILGRLGSVERFIAAALPLKVLPPRFNRYCGGNAYGDHIDNAVFSVPGSSHRIRSDLSATLFLSDPDEYEGGELVVEGELGRHRIKLPAGHLILYSGATLHQVTPVTRGVRLGAFFWIQSLVREDSRRTMLLELDDTIRALSLDLPDNPAVVRLTGLYHNLLRQWANT